MAKEKNQAAALAALLDADSFTSAATAAGISRRQLYNYLHHDRAFLTAYQMQRGQQAIEYAERAAAGRQKALDTIKQIMDDVEQPGAVRLKAAGQLLHEADEAAVKADKVMNGIEFDFMNPSRSL